MNSAPDSMLLLVFTFALFRPFALVIGGVFLIETPLTNPALKVHQG